MYEWKKTGGSITGIRFAMRCHAKKPSGYCENGLEGGTAFHNTNLTKEEKEIVERFFRDDNGGIVALASTTTLAAGINTPASTVILAEKEFVGDEGRPFTVAETRIWRDAR